MKKIFYECSSLISLDLSNFNINIFINMDYMFYKCNSLIYLHLSKLNTNNIIDMNNMIKVIQKCYKLICNDEKILKKFLVYLKYIKKINFF